MKKYKLMDKKTTYIDSEVVLGENVVVGPNVSLRGRTRIGNNTVIDANCIISDSVIGENNYIISSVIDKNNEIGDNNKIGPFSHLREGNKIGSYNEIGSFVEIKNSEIGEYNKIKHLTYIGNATLENKINIGAGVVFANYHSKKKKKEHIYIEDKVSVGSNCTLVAPVRIEKESLIGAGTTVRRDIDKDSLYFIDKKEIYKKGYYKGEQDDN